MKRAFTLIELLVVIAIIAILAAILFPVFAQAKAAAKKTNDLNQLKQHAVGALLYSSDYDDRFISVPAFPTLGSSPRRTHWADTMQPYLKNKGIFSDPSNRQTLYQDPGYLAPGQRDATDTDLTRRYRVTYTYNHYITRADDPSDSLTGPTGASQTTIPDVANTVLMGPSAAWYSWSQCRLNGQTADMFWNVSNGTAFAWGYEFWGGIEGGGYAGGANFAFADGSARYSKLVKGTDAQFGAGSNNLYVAYFVRAKTRPEVRTNGTCPPDYGSSALGF